MHPEIARDLISQHGRDLRDRAHQAAVARTVSRARRRARRTGEDDGSALPAIPDYVDGSFRVAGDEAAGRVPAA